MESIEWSLTDPFEPKGQSPMGFLYIFGLSNQKKRYYKYKDKGAKQRWKHYLSLAILSWTMDWTASWKTEGICLPKKFPKTFLAKDRWRYAWPWTSNALAKAQTANIRPTAQEREIGDIARYSYSSALTTRKSSVPARTKKSCSRRRPKSTSFYHARLVQLSDTSRLFCGQMAKLSQNINDLVI